MRFARVKCYDYPVTLGIDPNIAHTLNSLERRAQLSHAFITILAFGRNRDPLENGLIRTLQVVRIGRIEVMRIEWFNHRLSLLATVAPCRHRAQAAQFFAATVAPHLTAHHLSSRGAQPMPSGSDRGIFQPLSPHTSLSNCLNACAVPSASLGMTGVEIRFLFCRDLSGQGLERTPHRICQNLMTSRIWMDSVLQIQGRVARHALEQIRHESGMIFLRKLTEHFSKCGHIIIIRHDGKLHSDDHNQHVRITRSYFVNDCLQVMTNAFDRDTAKRIIDSKFHYEDVDLPVKMGR